MSHQPGQVQQLVSLTSGVRVGSLRGKRGLVGGVKGNAVKPNTSTAVQQGCDNQSAICRTGAVGYRYHLHEAGHHINHASY